jgi:diguanylate cyclase (GGDEF)-like protein
MPTPEEIEPLEILANMAALALTKAQSHRELQTALSQLQYINSFLRSLNEARSMTEVLTIVLRRGLELIPKAQGGSLLLLNEEENFFEFRAAIGRDLNRLRQCTFPKQKVIRALQLGRGPKLLTRSLQHQNTFWRSLTRNLGDPPPSTIVLPIMRNREIIGILNFNNFKEESIFSLKDIETISHFMPEIQLAFSRVHDHDRLREQALHDPLTSVYNRRYLTEVAMQRLREAREQQNSFALLMLDFDNFFLVNDRLGHAAGDRFLKEFAQFLQEKVRASDAVIRYGGDEFLIVLLETDEREAANVAKRLEEMCERWLKTVRKRKVKISLSIGLAVWTPKSKKTIDAVLDEADQFMYRRKRSKRSGLHAQKH